MPAPMTHKKPPKRRITKDDIERRGRLSSNELGERALASRVRRRAPIEFTEPEVRKLFGKRWEEETGEPITDMQWTGATKGINIKLEKGRNQRVGNLPTDEITKITKRRKWSKRWMERDPWRFHVKRFEWKYDRSLAPREVINKLLQEYSSKDVRKIVAAGISNGSLSAEEIAKNLVDHGKGFVPKRKEERKL